MNLITVSLNLTATTFGDGPYRPAVLDNATGKIWYWGIAFDSRDYALQRAQTAIDTATVPALQLVRRWNVKLSS